MKIGIIGLGRMGNSIAFRAIEGGHEVVGYDNYIEARKKAEKIGVTVVDSIAAIAEDVRIFWLMVPVSSVEDVIRDLRSHIKAGDIIVDGGNSKYTDSIRRAHALAEEHIFFLDCGTSGGVQGRGEGFCLMVGGDNAIYTKIHPLLTAIAAAGGVAHVGPSGAGHYAKMIHNGIEYALLQAYAEGFHLLKNGGFTLDLEEISRLWNNGSVIRSWILELIHDIFRRDQELRNISGEIAESGMGRWAVEEAAKDDIPARVIEEALLVRAWSRETGGNYATKLVALLRHEFGGHPVKKIKE